jgi:hypothetical protein
MAIKRGTPNRPRVNAKNYATKQAQKRLDENVASFNKQVENSLAVDAVQIELYQIQQLVGVPCSCAKTNVQSFASTGDDDHFAPVIPHKDGTNDKINIKFQDRDIFGDGLGEKIFNDAAVDVSGMDFEGDDSVREIEPEDDFQDSVLTGSINCGICYRTMFQPGFTAYGHMRSVFTSLNVENIKGVTVDATQMPHRFSKAAPNGFVEFLLTVPKYFKGVTVSVRNNIIMLHDRVFRADGTPLSMADLRQHAGHQIQIRIQASEFTHAVFDFDLGTPKLLANISAENIALDYDRLTTLSDMTVVLGPQLSDINPGDIIVIPNRNLVLKVRDKERKITASQRRLEWVVQTRVLQPTEPLKAISRGYKLI